MQEAPSLATYALGGDPWVHLALVSPRIRLQDQIVEFLPWAKAVFVELAQDSFARLVDFLHWVAPMKNPATEMPHWDAGSRLSDSR